MLGLSRRAWALGAALGVVLGAVYTLSPLSVWFGVAFAALCWMVSRGLTRSERHAVLGLLIAAAALRVLVIAALFLATDHGQIPYGFLFGDEEYFIRRSLWLRSMALGVNISGADMIYAYSEYSETSYLYVLAYIQALAGAAPYGVHLVNILLYLCGASLLYRLVRRSFGHPPAVMTLAGVLFLPSLFAWSVSALRESLHFLITVSAFAAAVEAVRQRLWWRRALAALSCVAALALLRDLRAGSMVATAGAIFLGVFATVVSRSRRSLATAAVCLLIVGGAALSRPAVQDRLLERIQGFALEHHGHVFTPGYHYKLLDDRFYVWKARSLAATSDMTWPEAARFVVRALASAVVVPVPWAAQSKFELAYIPEQILWYLVLVGAAAGFVVGRRIDPLVTFVLGAYVALVCVGVSLISGNVGTLIRHRCLVWPFLFCLSSLALSELLAGRRGAARDRSSLSGAFLERI